MTEYKKGFITAKVIKDEDGNAKLDIPFHIYHQTIVENGRNHYCYLTNDLIGKECLVFIHYAKDDEKKVETYDGYLGSDWKVVQNDWDASRNWTVKKEDALATVSGSDLSPVITKYKGTDCKDIIHPYMAEDK